MWRSIFDRFTRVKHSSLWFCSGETTQSEFGRRLNRLRSKFQARFSEGAVIPIWFSDVDVSTFDISRKACGITWNVDGDPLRQSQVICNLLVQKLAESRNQAKALKSFLQPPLPGMN